MSSTGSNSDGTSGQAEALRTLQERVQRLEEHAGFGEHELGTLARAHEDISRVLVALVKRVESIERRLETLSHPLLEQELVSDPGTPPSPSQAHAPPPPPPAPPPPAARP